MNSKQIREAFLDFFASKSHQIVPSAPMVVKNDPTLMFTNAGMNQFKEIFLGNAPVKSPRIADTQKCLRVSGKHNDLEEVGHDTYHHTMFEMLGNWSFGDYFKQEAIDWAWELLVGRFNIPVDRLYATVFEGDEKDGVPEDSEALGFWKKYLPDDHILFGNKKDNFWEMGDTGPCGPCSEIHVDIRNDEDRLLIPGREMVNQSHPQVIEIWNLVFIQFNRKANGQLEELPAKHVDTGMGFERLCMVLQKKQSNYDTDVFQPMIGEIGLLAGKRYGENEKSDIAMRVIADHIRAIAFAITDGQLPSNNKAGYVIRRILRRAVRYGYTFLGFKKPFLHQLIPVLAAQMGEAFPELNKQQDLVVKVIREEEESFLRTLETGIRMLENLMKEAAKKSVSTISGKVAFELYDTYGFPLDLTALILKEENFEVNREEFELAMEEQKNRSRNATQLETGDWMEIRPLTESHFLGYDAAAAEMKIARYRKVKDKKGEYFQLVFDQTPFYAESGGQIGDTGSIEAEGSSYAIFDTVKENGLSVHLTRKLPADPSSLFVGKVDETKRRQTASNHTATHLLDHALREILGNHIEQKGSLVTPDALRFDFSHFQKLSDEELEQVEKRVNELIRENAQRDERREIPMAEAEKMGAIALFGEKYGEKVRVIKFGDSIELCGGIHAGATGELGQFVILSEGSISAGVRRMEAITGVAAEEYLRKRNKGMKELVQILGNPADLKLAVNQLLQKVAHLNNVVEGYKKEEAALIKKGLHAEIETIGDIRFLAKRLNVDDAGTIKDIAFQLKGEVDNLLLVLAAEIEGKASVHVMISDNLVKDKGLHAGNIIRELAKLVDGGGGGQPFYASAGGKNPAGIDALLSKAREWAK
ncbi:MAG: alanine--tRNA ligase [Marinilabiliales bacterium]|nr:alanine--tRNA ligase [Marinilabiliales bacterium]